MREQEYEQLLREAYNQILNHKNLDASEKFFSKDVIFIDGKDTVNGLQEGKKLIKERSEAIPDYHCTVDDVLVTGNKAAVRWHSTGKATKDFADFKAGKPTNYSGISMFELKDGLISKVWQYGTAVDISTHS